jgi:hypothetical protein
MGCSDSVLRTFSKYSFQLYPAWDGVGGVRRYGDGISFVYSDSGETDQDVLAIVVENLEVLSALPESPRIDALTCIPTASSA